MPIKIDGMSTSGPSVSVLRMNDERTREADWDFSSELLDQEEALSAEQLDKLMRQIDDQGARLSRTPTYEELRSYRSLIQRFVGEAVKLRRIDEETLRELLDHIDGWKQRKAAKEGLLASLAPLFNLLAGGNTIEGLNAYVK